MTKGVTKLVNGYRDADLTKFINGYSGVDLIKGVTNLLMGTGVQI